MTSSQTDSNQPVAGQGRSQARRLSVRTIRMLKRSAFACLACLLLAGCQTPEERAMSQMERQMEVQMRMMERMQQNLDAMEKRLEAMNK